MPAADALVGEALNDSPYRELLKENECLKVEQERLNRDVERWKDSSLEACRRRDEMMHLNEKYKRKIENQKLEINRLKESLLDK